MNSVFASGPRLLLAGVALFLASTAAQAQATRTWVSGVGDDANPCSRTAPCKTFAGAISKTATAGIISVLDPGGFGTVTITKSITIDGGGIEGSILGGGTTGVIVNGANISVTLRNLSISGTGTGLTGVRFLNGHDLHIEHCMISQFNSAAPNGNGILMDVSSAGYHHLYVSDSTIVNNGSGNASDGGGIRIKPAGNDTYAYAYIERSRIDSNNGYGVKLGDNAFVNISESRIQGNARSGVNVISTALLADVSIHDSTLAGNGAEYAGEASLLVSGNNGIAHISGNAISQNEIGVKRVSSGHIFSYGNNRMMDNTLDGTVDGPDISL